MAETPVVDCRNTCGRSPAVRVNRSPAQGHAVGQPGTGRRAPLASTRAGALMGALDLDWRAGRILPAVCLVGLRRSLARACLGSPSRWHSGAVPPLAPRRNRNRPLVGPPKLACAFCGQPSGFSTGVPTSPGRPASAHTARSRTDALRFATRKRSTSWTSICYRPVERHVAAIDVVDRVGMPYVPCRIALRCLADELGIDQIQCLSPLIERYWVIFQRLRLVLPNIVEEIDP